MAEEEVAAMREMTETVGRIFIAISMVGFEIQQ